MYPEFFAKYYDRIYHGLRDDVDHRFYMEKILDCKGPVLEVGTGTGRFFNEALAKGADIYGIDVSPAMIEILREKLPEAEHSRVGLQSITDFRFNQKFKLIIAPFRVFMHLLTIEDQMQALRNVHEHLETGGTFLFDAFVPNLEILQHGISKMKDFEEEVEPGLILRRIVTSKSDLIAQVSHITFCFEFDNGKEITRKVWESDLRLFFRYELEHLMHQSPFSQTVIFGDMNGHGLNSNSREFVVEARK